jgi:hypothetical protein
MKSPYIASTSLLSIGGRLIAGLICCLAATLASAQDTVCIQATNYLNNWVRHRDFLGEVTPVVSELDQADATFILRPGLANPAAFSLESVNYPGYFLRHQDFRVKLQQNDHTPLFDKDATFWIRRGNSDQSAFESVNFPGFFIRHRNFHLYLEKIDKSNSDATFALFRGKPPGSESHPLQNIRPWQRPQ